MTLELRCVECRWLDPKLWSNLDKCACLHYWETPLSNKRSVQKNLKPLSWRHLPLDVWNGDCV